MGPVIRALTGDSIVIHFRNLCSFPVSLHPHGVAYDKENEGALSNDFYKHVGEGNAVPPGGSFTYNWNATYAPDADSSTKLEAYHSHVDEGHLNAGLLGPLVIGDPARCDHETMRPLDVDVEHFLHFMIFDEELSPYFDDNVERRFANKSSVPSKDPWWHWSNKKHALNGFLL